MKEHSEIVLPLAPLRCADEAYPAATRVTCAPFVHVDGANSTRSDAKNEDSAAARAKNKIRPGGRSREFNFETYSAREATGSLFTPPLSHAASKPPNVCEPIATSKILCQNTTKRPPHGRSAATPRTGRVKATSARSHGGGSYLTSCGRNWREDGAENTRVAIATGEKPSFFLSLDPASTSVGCGGGSTTTIVGLSPRRLCAIARASEG